MWLLAADSAAGNAAGAAGSAVGAAGAAELVESGSTFASCSRFALLKCIPEYIEIRRSSHIEEALCEASEPKCYCFDLI